jgi:hypothetical protein
MADHLADLLDNVVDQPSFLAFIDALANDFAMDRNTEVSSPSPAYGASALGWETGTVDAFLDAAHAWGKSTLGRHEFDRPDISPWRRCAEILYAGKIYE